MDVRVVYDVYVDVDSNNGSEKVGLPARIHEYYYET